MSLWLCDEANGLASLPVASRVAGQSLTSEKGETPADQQQALTAKPQGRASSPVMSPSTQHNVELPMRNTDCTTFCFCFFFVDAHIRLLTEASLPWLNL